MVKEDLRRLITEVLQEADLLLSNYGSKKRLYSEDAVDLLMMTAATESHLGKYLYQKGGGPARGIFQMEPFTEQDIMDNYLEYNEDLWGLVVERESASTDLAGDIPYQILMARIHYYRVPHPLPSTLWEKAEYWKTHYNTRLGKGTVSKAMASYETYCI